MNWNCILDFLLLIFVSIMILRVIIFTASFDYLCQGSIHTICFCKAPSVEYMAPVMLLKLIDIHMNRHCKTMIT